MGRRSEHTKDQLTEMAVQAASEMIAQEGLATCSARRVAQRMGYTVGTLYHLFDNFDMLTLHANGRTLAALEDIFAQVTLPEKGGALAVQALADAYVRFTQEQPLAWAALFEHRLPVGTALPEWYVQSISRLFHRVEEALPDTLSPAQRVQSARVLWAGIQGICALASTGKLGAVSQANAEVLVRDFIQHYLKGLPAT
jgi:AcrR family transcriptional regulator